MEELKNILRTAFSTVEETTSTNTPKRTETSPITRPTGSEVTVTVHHKLEHRHCIGTPRRTQSLLTSPTLPASLPVG